MSVVYQKKALALASATLSGGMRLAAAGSGLPQRIVEELDVHLGNIIERANGVVMDPDGLHVWAARRNVNDIRKIRISDGAVIATFTNNASDGGTRNIATPEGLTRMPGSTKVFCANAGAGNYVIEIDTSTLICRIYSNAVVTAPTHVVQGEAGKVWVGPTNGSARTYTEVSLAGTGDAAAVTGGLRTIGTTNVFDMVADGAGYLYYTTSVAVTRYKLSDDTTATVDNIGSIFQDVPGHGSAWRSIVWDPGVGRLLVNSGNAGNGGNWWAVDAAFTDITGRAFGFPERGGPMPGYSTIYQRGCMSFTDDGLKVAFTTIPDGAGGINAQHVRVVNLGEQRATWTWTPGFPIKVDVIAAAGMFGNFRGAIENVPNTPAYLDDVVEGERVKWFYSVSGGASDVQFDLADDMAVTVPAGETLTIYAKIHRKTIVPWSVRPFIGSVNGVGPTVFYRRPFPRNRAQGGL